MMLRNSIIGSVVLILVIAVSCAGLPTDPSSSNSAENSPNPGLLTGDSDSQGYNRYLWGYWNVSWDPDTGEIEAVPVREVQLHINVLKFLEESLCQTCLVFGDQVINGDGDLEIELGIIHPLEDGIYDADVFTGFDVRGIVIFGGTYYFDEHGLLMSNYDKGEYTIVDADGYTTLWSPAEYPPGWFGRPIFEYYPGKYEVEGTDMTTTLNPFMAFYTLTERRTFQAQNHDERIYTIRFPAEITALEFGYAVDASWARPVNLDSPQVPDDFPIDKANAIEAYRITAEFDGSLTPLGGQLPVTIRVYDWQGGGTIDHVRLEAPDLFNGFIDADFDHEEPLFTQYNATIHNNLEADLGTYPLLVSVKDISSVPILGFIDAYQVFNIDVSPPLDLLTTIDLSNYPVEGNFDTLTNTCYFSPVPAITELPIMGINQDYELVTGFPPVLPTGGSGLSVNAREIYLATDIGTNIWTADVSVYSIDTKQLKHSIDIPPLTPGNPASMPLDFVVFENAQDVWVSLNLEDQVGVFLAGVPSPDITRLETGGSPTTLTIDENNYRVFVACDGNDTISVVNGFTKTVDDTIDLMTPLVSPDPAFPATVGMAYVHSSNRLYVATLLYGRVDYYDLSDYSYEGTIQILPQDTEMIMGLIYDPVSGLLLATGGHTIIGQGYLWAIDPDTNQVIYEAATSSGNPSFPGLDSANHLVFVPDPAGLVDIFRVVY